MKNAARILTAFVAGFGLRLLATAAVKERAMHDAFQFREKAAFRTTAPVARARVARARGLPAAGLGRRERVERYRGFIAVRIVAGLHDHRLALAGFDVAGVGQANRYQHRERNKERFQHCAVLRELAAVPRSAGDYQKRFYTISENRKPRPC